MIVTMTGAISSWSSTMNVPMAMIRTGTTELSTLPVGVSPIVREISVPTVPDSATATTKMSTATTTFGR